MSDERDFDGAFEQMEDLRGGRSKISIDEIIRQYPEGVTVNGFAIFAGKDGRDYAVFTIAEEARYFSGGGDVAKLADDLVARSQGDIGAINDYLERKPRKLKIWKTRTQTGKTYTKVSPVKVKEEMGNGNGN